jgi:formiminoglutamase
MDRDQNETGRKLPVLLSMPHAGKEVPAELDGRVVLSLRDLYDDVDIYSDQIYDLGDKVSQVIRAEVARSFVDLNRDAEDLPPTNPDGVIKTVNCYQKPIYRENRLPLDGLAGELLTRYYFPYHRAIRKALEEREFSLALDCHTMAASGPPVGPDPGSARPLICLGNACGEACSFETTERLAACFAEAFGLPQEQVLINRPFAGGHITRTYGLKPTPWIQVELSRAMYLPDSGSALPREDSKRLEELNSQFERALRLYFNR